MTLFATGTCRCGRPKRATPFLFGTKETEELRGCMEQGFLINLRLRRKLGLVTWFLVTWFNAHWSSTLEVVLLCNVFKLKRAPMASILTSVIRLSTETKDASQPASQKPFYNSTVIFRVFITLPTTMECPLVSGPHVDWLTDYASIHRDSSHESHGSKLFVNICFGINLNDRWVSNGLLWSSSKTLDLEKQAIRHSTWRNKLR